MALDLIAAIAGLLAAAAAVSPCDTTRVGQNAACHAA
jgi:hypothetical protein